LKVLQAKRTKSGMAQRCLVIGSETLSRVVDKHDRDSMIYSDGAGASVIEALTMNKLDCYPMKVVLMRWMKLTICFFGKSYNPESDPDTLYKKCMAVKFMSLH
jgi:3-oxoacyl-[acyl-carrier-protein] synthase-3